MSQGVWVLVAALLAAGFFGLWRAARDGRFRGTRAVPTTGGVEREPMLAPHLLGERATLLQFSSAFCAPCRVTRRVLAEVVAVVPGVAHVELDAEQHLGLVRDLHVLRTPTTVVLDAGGREVGRAAGAPRRDEVLATLARVLDPE